LSAATRGNPKSAAIRGNPRLKKKKPRQDSGRGFDDRLCWNSCQRMRNPARPPQQDA
jgi:hypothetical protein